MSRQLIWKCTLPMKQGQWDNEYEFYDDGTIVHNYDKSVKKYNCCESILPTQIPSDDKNAILQKLNNDCPVAYRQTIHDLLQP